MISAGKLLEKEIPIRDICTDSEIYLLNSVKRWMPAQLDVATRL